MPDTFEMNWQGTSDTTQHINYNKTCSCSPHWGRVTHICVSELTIISIDNGSSLARCQAIIWTSAGILLILSLGTNSSEILSDIYIFSKFTPRHSPDNARRPQIWSASRSQKGTIMKKVNRARPTSDFFITYESGHDTSACKISGHSRNEFSGKCMENIKFDPFHWVKVTLKKQNQQTMTRI